MVVNGRNRELLDHTAEEIRRATGVSVTPVVADLSTVEGQAALLAACPSPDILINNNGGPPFRDFHELDRQALLTGITMNMVTPIELIQKVIDAMAKREFGRIVNITSISVKMPISGLDLSSGARAGLTAFMAGVARTVADKNVTINNLLPGSFNTQRLRSGFANASKKSGKPESELVAHAVAAIPASASAHPRSSDNSAPSSAAPTPPISRARTCCWTAEPIRPPFSLRWRGHQPVLFYQVRIAGYFQEEFLKIERVNRNLRAF